MMMIIIIIIIVIVIISVQDKALLKLMLYVSLKNVKIHDFPGFHARLLKFFFILPVFSLSQQN